MKSCHSQQQALMLSEIYQTEAAKYHMISSYVEFKNQNEQREKETNKKYRHFNAENQLVVAREVNGEIGKTDTGD